MHTSAEMKINILGLWEDDLYTKNYLLLSPSHMREKLRCYSENNTHSDL